MHILYSDDWQKKYIETNLENTTLEFVSDANTALQKVLKGEADTFLTDLNNVPFDLANPLVITALSERFSPNYTLLVKKERYDADAMFGLPTPACFFTDKIVQKLLEDVSPTFTFAAVDSDEVDALVVSQSTARNPLFDEKKYISHQLEARDFLPKAGAGVLAFICDKNDIVTRRLLKKVHRSDVAACTNVERALSKYFFSKNKNMQVAAFCEQDRQEYYHFFALIIDAQNQVKKARTSSSTVFGLVENMIAQLER